MTPEQARLIDRIIDLADSSCAPVTWEDPGEERRELWRYVQQYRATYPSAVDSILPSGED